MLRLPAALERTLQHLFPNIREREQFVIEAVQTAIDIEQSTNRTPHSVGGTLHLFCDGGSRGNPGQAAIAAILEDPMEGKVLSEHMERIGIETNNIAEYKALIAGLKLALPYQPNRLICHLDSELVVRQLNGEYQVKMPTLKPYFDEIQALAAELPDVVFTHIPREDNYRADKLVNRALDELPAPPSPTLPAQKSLFSPEPERPGDLYRQSLRYKTQDTNKNEG